MSTITISTEEYNTLKAQITSLTQQLDWMKRQLFGSKSERFVNPEGQMQLDLGITPVEVETKNEHIEYDREKLTVKEKKEGHSRGQMPTHLPFVDEVIIPEGIDPEVDREIGRDITWEVDYEPGKCFVRRFIRPKYADKKENTIVIADLPARPVDRGNFGPGIMASVTNDKYLYHLPLYRQSERFLRESHLKIAESTLCDIVKNTFLWIDPVFYKMKHDVFAHATYILADETHIRVLLKQKKGKAHKGYYWVYYDPLRKIVLFDYYHGRGRGGPNEFLKSYKNGIIQIDGYVGYNEVIKENGLTRAACMAHVRRKFEEALSYNKADAEYALSAIGNWFKIERKAKEQDLGYSERLELRNKNNLSEDFKDFKEWMLKYSADALPSDSVREACKYALGQWDYFDAYLTDGRVELSNNKVENAIRPVALGRKNFMFKGSEDAAQRGAVIYSIITTAKLHGLDPREYIKHLLEKLPGEKASNIEKYLPWAQEVADNIGKISKEPQ